MADRAPLWRPIAAAEAGVWLPVFARKANGDPTVSMGVRVGGKWLGNDFGELSVQPTHYLPTHPLPRD